MSAGITSRNNVRISGKGKNPILFAHGLGCDQSMWRYVAPAFENEYKVVLFDYAGHGKSDPSSYNPKKYATLSGYADDIISIIDELGLKNVTLVGHSVSNMIGVLAANKRPELFNLLVMIGPSPRYMNDEGYIGGFERRELQGMLDVMEKDYNEWVHFLSSATMKNPDHPELSEELEKTIMATNPAVVRQFAEVTFFSDNRPDIKKIKVPALIVQSSDDLIAPRSVGEYLYKNMPGSKFHLLETSGHCPHMSSPKETVSVIMEYLHKV